MTEDLSQDEKQVSKTEFPVENPSSWSEEEKDAWMDQFVQDQEESYKKAFLAGLKRVSG
jgi:hypothetical protein